MKWWFSGRGRTGAAGRSWSRALPIVFLGTALALAGLGAMEAYQSQRSHRAVARGVLTDYGEFAAWSFEQRVGELLAQRFNNTFGIVRGNPLFLRGKATEQCLVQLLRPTGPAACDCAPVRLAGGWSFFTRLGPAGGTSEWAGRTPAPTIRARVIDRAATHARERYEPGWTFALVQLKDGPLVAYTRLTQSGGRPGPGRSDARRGGGGVAADTLLYGVEVDLGELKALYGWILEEGRLLPESLVPGSAGTDAIQVDVLDEFGRVVFQSRPGQDHLYPAELRGRLMVGGATVRASVIPAFADRMIIGGLPEDRTPMLLFIFLLAAALAVASVVQMKREDRLARQRQDFVANVSHELRTPLAQVRLFTETLRLGRTRNLQQREWALENIDRETVRLSHLVENILRVSRAERGMQPPDRSRVDLGVEIAHAVDVFRPLVPPSMGTVVTELDVDLLADVHPDSIRQVILNYLDNAVRYGKPGQTVRVRGIRQERRIRILVDDEGPGVPEHARERVFDRFHRGEQKGGTAVAGSGIGLSVVRDIAENHGGRVWVENAPDGGARFGLDLPAFDRA